MNLDIDEVLHDFREVLSKLKQAYAEKYNCNPNYIQIIIGDDDCVSIIPTDETGNYVECYRGYI